MVRRTWLLGMAALLIGLILGGTWALHASAQAGPGIGGSAGLAAPGPKDSSNPGAKMKIFAQALALIEDQYVEPKTTKDLVYGAVQGAVSTLDPHSSFLTPEEFKELQIETKGQFSGIGIEITSKDQVLTVVSPIE